MDILRFHSAQRYVSEVPLRELSFCVTVWRAPLVEEHHMEILCSLIIPWDGKVYSPAEKIEIIRHAANLSEDQEQNEINNNNNNSISLQEEIPPSEEILGIIQDVLEGKRNSIHHNITRVIARELQEYFEKKTENAFFTRPSSEDYIYELDADCPVDPPQESSKLTSVILRQHRAQHRTSNNMYFMWAVGNIFTPNNYNLSQMYWEGEERVICTITAERNEYYFTAKPSINETHTLFVDSLHVYSFKITVSTTEEKVPTQSTPGDLIQKISRMALQIKDHLRTPFSARQDALQRILLLQATNTSNNNNLNSENLTLGYLSNERSSFTQAPYNDEVRFHIFGTIDKCIGVAEDAVCLRCQWQYGPHKEYDNNESENEDDLNNINNNDNMSFTTQLAFAGCMLVDDFITLPVHTFNTPFEYHFTRNEATSPLFLILTLFSDTSMLINSGHQSPVGYAALLIPHELTGKYKLRAQLWRPRVTGREFIRSAFVGGAPSLVDARDAAPRCINNNNNISVRQGLATEPSGEVEVSVMIMQHRHRG